MGTNQNQVWLSKVVKAVRGTKIFSRWSFKRKLAKAIAEEAARMYKEWVNKGHREWMFKLRQRDYSEYVSEVQFLKVRR